MAERGGCRQKRARYEAESAEAATEGSQLAFFLVSQTMWGAMSTKLCKTIAEHARRDIEYANLQHNGFIFKDLNALAYVSSNHSYEHLRQKISPPRMHVDNISLPLKVAGRKFWVTNRSSGPTSVFMIYITIIQMNLQNVFYLN